MNKSALEGYRVVDFGWVAAGPILGAMLSNMGAEVIKVESKTRMDSMRISPDNLEQDPEKDPWFHSIHRNKLGITVDMARPKGAELLKRLIKISDIVIENFSPKVMPKFGLDYEGLEKVKPDTVVLATGGKSVIPDIPGINVDKVTTAQDVLACKITTGKKVLIAGGGRLGCEVAHFLTEFGKEITLVEKSDIIAGDLAYGPMQLLTKQLIELGVKIITLATIKRIADNHVIIDRNGCEEIIHDVDHVVLALGVEPVRDLEDDLRGKVTEIHVIGDAETPANALKAISAGAAVGRQI